MKNQNSSMNTLPAVGQKVRFWDKTTEKPRAKTGIVLEAHRHYVTVQTRHYVESINAGDRWEVIE